MMRELLERGRALAERRAAELAQAIVDAAEAELPAGLTVERIEDGVAIRGRGLVRRLAFDGRLRGLTLLPARGRR